MGWLLHNYFVPALNPSAPPQTKSTPLRPVQPLLTQYKALLKTTTRDASLRSQYKTEITQVLRDIERWLAEAKVAADVSAATLELDPTEAEGVEEDDSRERWALEKLCDALLEKGGLVPLSKKSVTRILGSMGLNADLTYRKRVVSNDPFRPSAGVLAIWTPLLSHLQALHPSLHSVLVSRIVAVLLTDPESASSRDAEAETILFDGGERKHDPSYDMCLASWAHWILTAFDTGVVDTEDDAARVEEAAAALVIGLGPHATGSTRDTRAYVHQLADKSHSLDLYFSQGPISARHTLQKSPHSPRDRISPPRRPASIDLLSTSLPSSPIPPVPSTDPPWQHWSEQDLATMSERLDALVAPSRNGDAPAPATHDSSSAAGAADAGSTELPTGWRVVSARDGWRPAPIGVHVAGSSSR